MLDERNFCITLLLPNRELWGSWSNFSLSPIVDTTFRTISNNIWLNKRTSQLLQLGSTRRVNLARGQSACQTASCSNEIWSTPLSLFELLFILVGWEAWCWPPPILLSTDSSVTSATHFQSKRHRILAIKKTFQTVIFSKTNLAQSYSSFLQIGCHEFLPVVQWVYQSNWFTFYSIVKMWILTLINAG